MEVGCDARAADQSRARVTGHVRAGFNQQTLSLWVSDQVTCLIPLHPPYTCNPYPPTLSPMRIPLQTPLSTYPLHPPLSVSPYQLRCPYTFRYPLSAPLSPYKLRYPPTHSAMGFVAGCGWTARGGEVTCARGLRSRVRVD
eukprot:2680455-Rhodomonas_salina.1